MSVWFILPPWILGAIEPLNDGHFLPTKNVLHESCKIIQDQFVSKSCETYNYTCNSAIIGNKT